MSPVSICAYPHQALHRFPQQPQFPGLPSLRPVRPIYPPWETVPTGLSPPLASAVYFWLEFSASEDLVRVEGYRAQAGNERKTIKESASHINYQSGLTGNPSRGFVKRRSPNVSVQYLAIFNWLDLLKCMPLRIWISLDNNRTVSLPAMIFEW